MDRRRDLRRLAHPDTHSVRVIAGVPTSDFADNRVMWASPRDLYDPLADTFDYLVDNEPMGLLVVVMHCQFGGRPLITAALQTILKYFVKLPSCWIARHKELASRPGERLMPKA